MLVIVMTTSIWAFCLFYFFSEYFEAFLENPRNVSSKLDA